MLRRKQASESPVSSPAADEFKGAPGFHPHDHSHRHQNGELTTQERET